MTIIQNYKNIRSQIDLINSKVKLIVVSKGRDIDSINEIIKLGHLDFGENRVQETISKWNGVLERNKNINLHLVGKLQSNKAKDAHKIFTYIHSLDNQKLAKNFSQIESSNSSRKLKYFVQINIGNEPQKGGIDQYSVSDFINFSKNDLKLNIVGLMCLPPVDHNPTEFFLKLKELAKVNKLSELSMGMSNDYKEAINCGSTFVRIGSGIFN
jgi:pyridoxal phosphate enzyme (YggS family)